MRGGAWAKGKKRGEGRGPSEGRGLSEGLEARSPPSPPLAAPDSAQPGRRDQVRAPARKNRAPSGPDPARQGGRRSARRRLGGSRCPRPAALRPLFRKERLQTVSSGFMETGAVLLSGFLFPPRTSSPSLRRGALQVPRVSDRALDAPERRFLSLFPQPSLHLRHPHPSPPTPKNWAPFPRVSQGRNTGSRPGWAQGAPRPAQRPGTFGVAVCPRTGGGGGEPAGRRLRGAAFLFRRLLRARGHPSEG